MNGVFWLPKLGFKVDFFYDDYDVIGVFLNNIHIPINLKGGKIMYVITEQWYFLIIILNTGTKGQQYFNDPLL